MEVEQPPIIHETSKMMKSRVLDELDDNLEGGNPCNGNNLSSFINGIHDGNGHGHVGRSLSVGDSIPEEDEEEELDLEELENTTVDINGAGQRKGHRSGSFASTGSNKSGGNISARDNAAARLIRKAKRTSRDRAYSTSEEGPFGGCPSAALGMMTGARNNLVNKNSRKSRNGLGRGLPKKGGAGGKGTWGKLGCELELPWVDPNDPNYESDGDENIVNDAPAHLPTKNGGQPHGPNVNGKSHGHGTTLKTMVPEMSEEDVNKAVEPLILEYFENNDATEVLYTLQEMLMNFGSRRWMVVSILIELAMDHKPSHREMASVLISELYLKVISQRDIGKAFDYLLRQLPDLILDTPDACDALGNFLARAIADDCIPPKFLHSYKGHPDNTAESKSALQKADTLLSMKHGMVRLDNVWGVGGGVRPVKYLVKKIVLLLKEYLCSGDIKEATRCLQELEVPHFHHELVYEAVVMVIESMHEKTDEAMCKLLQALFRSFVITIDQMKNGFGRVYDFMPEIAIDVPAAYTILERFVNRCRKSGLITDELVRKMPTRGRKRFVSEGDGGRVKDNWW